MPIHDWTRVNTGIFHDFHHEWISTIKRALNEGVLPPGYYALAEQVVGGLGPDVLALENIRPQPPQTPTEGGLALATSPPRVRFTAAAEAERYARRRDRITVRHSGGDQVVAVVEIVSPGNKASRHALRSFAEKALELLDGGIHLLLIDLFPPGPRDPQGIHGAIWSEMVEDGFQLPAEQPLTLVAYSAGEVKRAFIEPVAVGQALPPIPLFLKPDLYVSVPLEPTYLAAFAAVPQRWQEELRPAPAG